MILKRLMDIALSLVVLVLALPVFIIVPILIRRDGPGPVFYRQARVGQGGRVFQMLKYRSMVTNADQIGGHSTAPGDARITRTGAILRKTSLDELPQLLNVLRGDMSLVGPRPDVPAQEKDYTPEEWRLRTSVLPGITGLAQATRRSEAAPGERKQLDLDYVARRSLALDFRILAMTVRQVLGRGGY